MNPSQLKLMGYFFSILLVLNIVLFSFRVIDWKVFWGVIIMGAVFAYLILPKVKKF